MKVRVREERDDRMGWSVRRISCRRLWDDLSTASERGSGFGGLFHG